jgi:hypothetical protein
MFFQGVFTIGAQLAKHLLTGFQKELEGSGA